MDLETTRVTARKESARLPIDRQQQGMTSTVQDNQLDEYKDRYIIIAFLKTPPRYYRQRKTPQWFPAN